MKRPDPPKADIVIGGGTAAVVPIPAGEAPAKAPEDMLESEVFLLFVF